MHSPNRSRPQLHLITPPELEPTEIVRRVELALPHGVDAVHVRLPGAAAREVYDLAMVLQAPVMASGARLIVNDRVDVALAVNASGVQLGARSLPVQVVRRVLGAHAPVGVSVHGVDEAREAASTGASWLLFGHVYETGSHPGEPPRGLERLGEVSRAIDIPVIAIGGITPERVGDVMAAGASGVAVLSGILGSPDVAAATREMRRALEAAQRSREATDAHSAES